MRSHFGEEGVKAIIPPSPLFVPPKQNDRLADIYKAVLPCLGRESNPHGLFGPRDFKSLVSTIPPPRLIAAANIAISLIKKMRDW